MVNDEERLCWLQALAYQVWESGGRREGRQDHDWRIAEQLLDVELALRASSIGQGDADDIP